MRLLAWIVAVLLLATASLAAWSLWISRPLFDQRLDAELLRTVPIAAPDDALTFARWRDGGRLRVLLVTRFEDGVVHGLPSDETDPLALFAANGYEVLAEAARSPLPQVAVPADALELPFDAPLANIGIGTNYVEHARESQVREQPFLFPKRVQPTGHLAPVPKGDARLLDYEAELGFVALDDLRPGAPPAHMGLVLGNDFTDRWSLVKNLDRDGEMGTTGFVEGKSRAGFAPIGNLLVIPRDLEAFYREVQLFLYVNGRMRQMEQAGRMLWGPAQMLGETFRRQSWTFREYAGTVPLLPQADLIPRGTIIFSGTPAGVIFKPLNLWNAGLYLQAGDDVAMHSPHLGTLRNRIAP